MTVRLAYLVSHPIQYQAPLLRRIATEPGIDFTVLFLSDMSTGRYPDPGFGTTVEWDVDVVGGFRHEFLPGLGGSDRVTSWRPWTTGLDRTLRRDRFDVLWVHGYAHPTMLRAIRLASRRGLRVLVRGESQEASGHRVVSRGLRRLVLPTFFRLPDAFLSIGTRNRRYYLAHGVTEDRIFSMPYAVDNEFFRRAATSAARARESFRRELGLPNGRPVILMASKLQSHKGPIDLLEAFATLATHGQREPEPLLLFVGDGSARAELEVTAASYGLSPSVRFVGFRNQQELPRFYDLAHVVVLPSRREPWGLVVNEAMNASRPVVVSDAVGCADDLVVNGETGFVFPAGDSRALAVHLATLVNDRDLARRMGESARARVSQFDFEADVAGLRQALSVVCGPRYE
jgi:glycosyltransferase involved in cell wall biosynthesis